MILAGDVGGTSTRLALFAGARDELRLIAEASYRSGDFGGLADVLVAFRAQHSEPFDAAGFGIAGPVIDDSVATTNLPWAITASDLARALGLAHVRLINDLEANAWGVAAVDAAQLLTVQAGRADAIGHRTVVSAGTGLGVAGLFWDGRMHRPFATEAGHIDFAPRDRLETELLADLAARYARVSCERVLSGPGLVRIFEFLERLRPGRVAAGIAVRMRAEDPAAVIAAAALAQECEVCVEALDRFVAIYGAVAGNIALAHFALGGVYLGGGIAPKIAARLATPAFIEAFLDKGRMRSLLEAIPVRVVLDPQTALRGVARCVAHDLGSTG